MTSQDVSVPDTSGSYPPDGNDNLIQQGAGAQQEPSQMYSERNRGNKIVVLGIPWQTDSATLEHHFSQFGTVEEAQIMRERYTGKSRGFGFVTFTSPEDAERAIATDHLIDGRRCEAKYALPEGKVASIRTTRIFVARIPASVTDSEFRSYFEQFGTVQDAYMPKDPSKQGHRGIGFVTFASPDSVEAVISQTHVLNGNEIAIDRATPKDRNMPLPGRAFMSQPNLHMMGGGLGVQTGHSMSLRTGGPYMGSRYGLSDAAGGSRYQGGGYHGNMGYRRSSQPMMSEQGMAAGPSSQHDPAYNSNTSAYGGGGGIPGSGMGGPYSSSGADLNLLAQAHVQAAVLQQQLSSNSLSSMDGTGGMQQSPQGASSHQLMNIIGNAGAAAGSPPGHESGPVLGSSGYAAGQAGGSGGIQSNNHGGHMQAVEQHRPDDLMGIFAKRPRTQVDQFLEPTPSASMAAAGMSGWASARGLAPGGMPAGPPSARAGPRIFVGKLPREANERDVKDYFSRFGYVLDVYLPRDKSNKREHRGFGFVTFETEASIKRVVSHGPHHIHGAVVAIDSAVPRQEEIVVGMDQSGAHYVHSTPAKGMAMQGSKPGQNQFGSVMNTDASMEGGAVVLPAQPEQDN